MRIYDGFIELSRLEKEYANIKDYDKHLAMGTAIDLWDGMLKGKQGDELQNTLNLLIKIYRDNATIDQQAAPAYEAAIEVAELFLND